MSVTHIQTNIIRLKNEVSNLSVKIADKRKRATLAMEKANKANVEALKTKSTTIAKNKITESERYNKEAIKYNKEIAELEKNRASKEKLLMSEEQKLVKEQAKENRKITDLMQTVNMVQLEHSKLKEIYPLLSVPSEDAYDVFISHASEDKETFVTVTVTPTDDIRDVILEILSPYEKDDTGYIVEDIDSLIKTLKEKGIKIKHMDMTM